MTERVPTGIEGFDRLIQGGLPRNTVNLVTGPAGSGKSLFALHYALNGAGQFHEPALYVAVEETKASVERVMRTFGMESAELERARRFLVIDLGELRIAGRDGSPVGFEEVRDFLSTTLPRTGARRLVIDSLSAVGLRYPNPDEFRERLFTFCRFLRDQDVTTVLVSEAPEGQTLTRYGVEQFLTDSFIHLNLEEVKGELRRTVTVRKMRFTKHDTAKHPCYITSAGLTVVADEKVV